MSAKPPNAAKDTPPSDRATVQRRPERGRYQRAVIDAILDEALICHVGFIHDGQPFVIPTAHVRVGDRLFIHGSPASRMLQVLRGGVPACVTVTLLDGLVLARSAMHHSMNYRSVVVLARGAEVVDRAEKLRVLDALVQHLVPGRGADIRGPNENELAATTLIGFPLDEASAKVRAGPPRDDESDLALPVWAGVIPLSLAPATPQPDPLVPAGAAIPSYARVYRRPGAPSPARGLGD